MLRNALARRPRRRRISIITVLGVIAAGSAGLLVTTAAPIAEATSGSPCGATVNPIVCENRQPGTPDSVWDIDGYGDPSIQGFATDISVNAGAAINFKIDTNAKAYTIDIYRLGYYGGDGARHVASVSPSAKLPQVQPACATNASTSLYDCGTWAVSATWSVPSTAVSGVYLADLKRTDTGGMSQISFVVRNDSSTSDIVYQTSDETWEAYNRYGGSDFYTGDQQNLFDSPTRARALSYNRPFITRGDNDGRDFLFSNEYPTIRFLEQNGYDVTYIAGVDTDRYGATLLQHHKVFLSVGHDEYWSQPQLTNVVKARDAGVNLMFLSGNEVYWHTRFANSIDGTNTPYRTLICYKETWDNAASDPSGEATATWRDPRFATPPGGANPENSLTGTMYEANTDDLPITVTKDEGKLRVWRGTTLSSMTGASTKLAADTVGYESDEDVDNGFRPAGEIDLTTTVGSTPQELQDFGTDTVAGTTTHHVTEYRAASGALVFGAGTIQWAWGLSNEHDGGSAPADSRMQQATVNTLADMGVQPQTLMSGLVSASKSTDSIAPTAVITSPTSGANVANGTYLTVSGTATDKGGGVVAGVEVSLDGGGSWHPATGTASWSYSGIVHGVGAVTIEARATDDSLNTSAPTSIPVSVTCPCSLFGNTVPGTTPSVGSGTTSPALPDSGDGGAYELGVTFHSTVDGVITGIRFYKSAANTGTHTGTLWTASGTQLATGTFTGETASGWQTLKFAQPVAVTKNTSYVASYWDPNGHYAEQQNYFYYTPYTAAPLVAPVNTPTSPAVNGAFGTSHGFPSQSFSGTNYYVDVLFSDAASAPPLSTSQTPAAGATGVSTAVAPTATFSKAMNASSIVFSLKDGAGNPVAGTTSYAGSTSTATFTPQAPLTPGTRYVATVNGSDTGGSAMSAPLTWSFVTAFPTTGCPCTILGDAWTPGTANSSDNSVELGVTFTSDTSGVVTGVRFYKGSQNTGAHSGELWSSSGTLLATANFSGESASGWQTASFTSPVSITAGTSYVASYFTSSGYSSTSSAFANSGIDNFPLHVPVNGGAYGYGASSTFPGSASSSNYGVDVMFTVPSSVVPTVTSTSPADGDNGVDPDSALSATFSTSVLRGSPTVTVTAADGSAVAGSVALNSAANVITFSPAAALSAGAKYTMTVTGAQSLSGTAQAAPSTTTFTVDSGACPCSLFRTSQQPASPDSGDTAPATLGMAFSAAQSGYVTGVRFYKSAANTGAHVGALWSASGTLLATVTFSGESANGWQTASFAQAVPVTAGTTYVVSYFAPNGHYSYTSGFFATADTRGPLTAPAGANGVFDYDSSSQFPTSSYNSTNYWVDALFTTTPPPDTTPPSVTSVSPPPGSSNVPVTTNATATFSEPITTSSLTFTVTSKGSAVPGQVTYDAGSRTATFTPSSSWAGGTFAAAVSASDLAGNAMTAPYTWSFSTAGACPCSLFASTATPAVADSDDPSSVNLGTQFVPSQSGDVTGARFYKSAANTGAHSATLWSASGTSLATASFTGESASGWQSVTFSTPVAVTAGSTYVISYNAPNGHYSATSGFFADGYTNGPLSAPAQSNGVYAYGPPNTFPTSSYNATNYYVDVIFSPTPDPPGGNGAAGAVFRDVRLAGR